MFFSNLLTIQLIMNQRGYGLLKLGKLDVKPKTSTNEDLKP